MSMESFNELGAYARLCIFLFIYLFIPALIKDALSSSDEKMYKVEIEG
jgi:hypothetical protein